MKLHQKTLGILIALLLAAVLCETVNTWRHQRLKSQCLSRLLPTAENPETFAGTVKTPSRIREPVFVLYGKNDGKMWLESKLNTVNFLPLTVMLQAGSAEVPVKYDINDQNQGWYFIGYGDNAGASIRLFVQNLNDTDQIKIELKSGSLTPGEIAYLELYEGDPILNTTLLIDLSLLFILLIAGWLIVATGRKHLQSPARRVIVFKR